MANALEGAGLKSCHLEMGGFFCLLVLYVRF